MMAPTMILVSGTYSQLETCWLASLDYLLYPMSVREENLQDGWHMRIDIGC